MVKEKKLYVITSILLVALFVSACAAPPPDVEDEQLVVGWSGAPLLDDFQFQLRDGIMGTADELGIEIRHIEHDNDPIKQASDIEDLLAQNIDALLIAAAQADAVVPSVQQAVDMGIPVFSIDNAANTDLVLSHSGNDLFCIGYRSLEYLAEQIGGEGKILHINGFAGMALVAWNDQGVQAYLDENPNIELVMTAYADWDPAIALSATEDILLSHPDLEGIYVIAEIMTAGPIQALRAMGLSDQVKIMSGGLGPDSQEFLANGDIIATMEWRGEEGAREHMQRIYDYLVNDIEPEPFAPLPVFAHTAEGDTWQVNCPIGDWQP